MKKKTIIIALIVLIAIVGSIIVFKLIGDNKPLIVERPKGEDGYYIDKEVIQFKKGIATTIESIYTFDDEKSQEEVYKYMEPLMQDKVHNSEFKVRIEGNQIIADNTIESYVNYNGCFTKIYTKKELKDWYVKNGFKVISE